MNGTKPTETHAMDPSEALAKGVAGSAGIARTHTGAGVLEDLILESPVDIDQMRTRRIFFWGTLAVVAGLLLYSVAT